MANNTNWLNISSQSGSSGQTILTLSANKNLSTNYKTAEITAYNPVYNISAKTYVTLESYAPILSISPGLFGVPDSGGTYELTVSANCAWVIAFPDLVTSFSTSAGSGNAVVTFTVPGTTADTTLAGNIVVTDESGQVSRTARVEQYGSGVHIGIFPVELYFDSTGGSQTFTVTADAAYNVSVGSGTDWAFVEPNSGYTGQTVFTVRVDSGYTGTTDRQGVINIDAPGQDLAVILYQRKPETRVVVTYNVTSTTDPTKILGDISSFSKAELADGTEITLGTGYTFPSTGSVNVYYTLTGTGLANNCFRDCTDMTEIFIPDTVTSYGLYCFENTALKSFEISDNITYIGNYCFEFCESLSSVTIGSGITTLPNLCFNRCTSLTEVVVPPTITAVNTYCFRASGLETIYFSSSTPPTLGNAALDSGNLQQIIVPCVYADAYIAAWSQYAQYISCQDTGTTLYFVTDTSNVKGIGETRTITILNTNINSNDIGLTLPSDFPQQGSYTVDGMVIYLTYPRNPSSSATRNWTIGVVAMTKDGVSLSGSYQITQNANPIYSIPYTADTSTVDASGETRTITIDTSNLVASSITIGIEGATGVTYTYENGVITIIFPQNTGGEKNATVYVYGETTSGNSAAADIVFEQEAYVVVPINYTGDTSVVSRTGETRTITIDTSNLVASSISVVGNGSTGITYSYNNGVITVVFPQNYGEEKDFQITVTGLTTNGYDAMCEILFQQEPYDLENSYLTFNIISDGVIGWFCTNTDITRVIQYRVNKGEWAQLMSVTIYDTPTTISVTNGDVVEFRGDNAAYGGLTYDNRRMYNYFWNTAKFKLSGNIMSLVHSVDFATATTMDSAFTFYGLFSQRCTGLTSANSLVLPTVSLTEFCYGSMFSGCISLTAAPALPATTLSLMCYCNMFNNCRSLTIAPVLSATTLATSCYDSMFSHCTSLTTAPDLPATTLAGGCYDWMFSGCTALTFIKCLATDMNQTGTHNWVRNVATTGTFVKDANMNDWTTGESGIPSGWTVQDAT